MGLRVSILLIIITTFFLGCVTRRIDPTYEGRVFYFSNSSPVANALTNSSSFVKSTAILSHHFNQTEKYIKNQLRNNREQAVNNNAKICNSVHEHWDFSTPKIAESHGWPFFNSTCTTDLFNLPHVPLFDYSVQYMYDVLKGRITEFNLVNEGIKSALNYNWSNVYYRGNNSMELFSIECSLQFVAAIRSSDSGRWYIITTVLSSRQDRAAKSHDRAGITEYLYALDGKLITQTMDLPEQIKLKNGTTTHAFRNDTTTKIAFWDGPSSSSAFLTQLIEENEATKDALQNARLKINHAEDTLSWSNLAILSLPLLLNLTPVSILTRIPNRKVLTFVILSDLVGSIPMLIKGVEILWISNETFMTSLTRMADPRNLPQYGTISAELWVAQCNASKDRRLHVNGLILVLVACSTTIAGICIELVANSYGKKKYRFKLELIYQSISSSNVNDEKVRDVILSQIPDKY